MKNLFLALSVWLSLCCAVSGVAQAQGTYFQGAMVPSAAPFIGFALIQKSGSAAALTGSTAETVLATITLPPNTLGANGALRIRAMFSVTNSANGKTYRFRLGGLAGTLIASTTSTTTPNVESDLLTINANATNAQNTTLLQARGTDGLVATSTITTTAVDMTQSQSLVITGQLALGTETMTLLGYTVEVAN